MVYVIGCISFHVNSDVYLLTFCLTLSRFMHWASSLSLHRFFSCVLLHWLCSSQPEHSPFDVGDEVLPNVVRVQNAKLDNPAGLEEENGDRAQTKEDDAPLYTNNIPRLREPEEGDRRDH